MHAHNPPYLSGLWTGTTMLKVLNAPQKHAARFLRDGDLSEEPLHCFSEPKTR